MKKIVISLLVLTNCILATGCSMEDDLSKYGITEKSEVKSSNNNIKNEEKQEKQQNEEKRENNTSEEHKIKYPISNKIDINLRNKNEIYLSEIIELLNTEYYLGINPTITEREKDELSNKLETKISEYRLFVSDNGIGKKEIDNGYGKYTIGTYLDQYYYDILRFNLSELESIDSQKRICRFISNLTMMDYSQVVNERSQLIGISIYKPHEILDFICNNEEVVSTYINSNTYDKIKDTYNRDLYNVHNFMKIKFDNGIELQDDLKEKLTSYLEVYEKWVNSYEDSKSVINNEVRYYNESKQIELYEEMKVKIEDINTKINDIYGTSQVQ